MARHPTSEQAREAAEALAVQALGFLVSDPERLGAFLAMTGLGPDTVRSAAADPAFLPSVLDYLIENEPVLVAFAEAHGHEPETIVAAREVLGASGKDRSA